ncbi:MAG: DUF6653 family protein [Desulfovibrio sp.]
MDLYELTQRLMGMRAPVWDRHANPWSVYTRVPLLPLFALAIWSRVWIGWWAALPVLLLVFWTWLNPRLFPPPRSIENWASKGVLGERLWLNRKRVSVPGAHRRMAWGFTVLALLGTALLVWGLYALRPWPTLLGVTLAVCAKLLFVDRMARLFEDMRDMSGQARPKQDKK